MGQVWVTVSVEMGTAWVTVSVEAHTCSRVCWRASTGVCHASSVVALNVGTRAALQTGDGLCDAGSLRQWSLWGGCHTVQALFQRDTEQRQNHRGRLSLELKRRDHPDCIAAAHPQPDQPYTNPHLTHRQQPTHTTHTQGGQDIRTHSAGCPKRGVWLDTLYDAATRTACDTHTATATQAQRKQVRTNFCPAAMRQFKPYIYLPIRHCGQEDPLQQSACKQTTTEQQSRNHNWHTPHLRSPRAAPTAPPKPVPCNKAVQ